MLHKRLKASSRAFALHVAFSVLVAFASAVVVFFVWYPQPYASLSGGINLFILIVSIDLVCGPLLTLVLFNPQKSRRELAMDLSIVAMVQIAALAYGLNTIALARPVYLAYELDRFRVVSLADLKRDDLSKMPNSIPRPGWTGPKLIAVRVAQPDDSDYLEQVELSLNGLETAYRPDRWDSYENQKRLILRKSYPIDTLMKKYPKKIDLIKNTLQHIKKNEFDVKWLPMQSRKSTGWVALIDKNNSEILGFLPLDGF